MEIAITRLSSKGQIVIPAEMRRGIKRGEKLIILKNDSQLIMKRISDLSKDLKKEIEFAKRTEKAWEEYEKGKFTSSDTKDFLKELKEW